MTTMDTANGTLRIGQMVRILGGENRGKRGTITHLYTNGVMAGLVVVDERVVAEGVNTMPLMCHCSFSSHRGEPHPGDECNQ